MMMKFHEIANIFPMMSKEEFAELKQDITKNGLREPIVVYGDKIIDGRNRYKACKDLNIEPKFCIYDPKVHGDPVSFVMSLNLQRRHLKSSQKAMIAANIATLKQGEKHCKDAIAIPQQQAANHLGISNDSIQRAKRVKEHGIEELVEAVTQGNMAVSKAALIADAPQDEQPNLMQKTHAEIKEYFTEQQPIQNIPNDHYDLIFIDSYYPFTTIQNIPTKNDSMVALAVNPQELQQAFDCLKIWKLQFTKLLTCHSNPITSNWTNSQPTYCIIAYKNIISEAIKDLPDSIISNSPTDSFTNLLLKTPIGSSRIYYGNNSPKNWESITCK